MITDADINKLKGTFATKVEMNEKFEVVDGKMDSMAAAIGRIENSLDGIAGAIQDLRTENGAGAVHLARHDRQIETLAFATNVVLPY
jgi:hypothetical protein